MNDITDRIYTLSDPMYDMSKNKEIYMREGFATASDWKLGKMVINPVGTGFLEE